MESRAQEQTTEVLLRVREVALYPITFHLKVEVAEETIALIAPPVPIWILIKEVLPATNSNRIPVIPSNTNSNKEYAAALPRFSAIWRTRGKWACNNTTSNLPPIFVLRIYLYRAEPGNSTLIFTETLSKMLSRTKQFRRNCFCESSYQAFCFRSLATDDLNKVQNWKDDLWLVFGDFFWNLTYFRRRVCTKTLILYVNSFVIK